MGPVVENLNSLVIFTRAVEAKSLTAAARSLRISASAVSKHIARLETSVGAPLFNRSTRKLVLTEYGKLLYQRCTRAVHELEDAQTSLKGMNRGLTGTLRMHVTPGIGQRFVEPAVVQFMKRHGDLSLDLSMSAEILNPLDHGYDVTIRSGSSEDRNIGHSSLSYREFGPLRYLICASPEYIKDHGIPAEPRDLVKHNCLVQKTQDSDAGWWFLGPKGKYTVPVSGNIVSNSHTTIYEAALAGLGIARLMTFEANEARNLGKLKFLFENEIRSERLIRAFYPRTNPASEKVRRFLDFLSEHLAKGNHIE